MAGSLKNIGAFRDQIIVKYLSSQGRNDLGEMIATYSEYTVFADVIQIKSSEAKRYGMDMLNDNYIVTMRPPLSSKPYFVTYNETEYKVISAMIDKVNQFAELIITKDR